MAGKIHPPMPAATIDALARSVFEQATAYGFSRLDHVRLTSALLSLCNEMAGHGHKDVATSRNGGMTGAAGPASDGTVLANTDRLEIRLLRATTPANPAEGWLRDLFSAHFLVSSATAQARDLGSMLAHPGNLFGTLKLQDGRPIGLVAYLDHDELHRKAEFRIVIGDKAARRQGYALEAGRAWLAYGTGHLRLGKVFALAVEGDVRSSRLFQQLGLVPEAVLPGELLMGGQRETAIRWSFLDGSR